MHATNCIRQEDITKVFIARQNDNPKNINEEVEKKEKYVKYAKD